MNANKRIVVTGLGPLSAIGFGKGDLWKSIVGGTTGLAECEYPVSQGIIEKYFVHKINNFNIDNFGIEEKFLKDLRSWKGQEEALDLFYLLAVTKLALDDSNIDIDKNTVGLVLAHENPGLDQFYTEIINESYGLSRTTRYDYFKEICEKFSKRGYDLQTFMFLYHVTRTFNIHGYSLFLNNACASGLYAIETAADIIKTGKCNCVIVSASDQSSIFKYLWFKTLDMYPDDGLIKPFAKNRNGFVLGDGGASIVLESLDSASKRNAHIYAEYLGGGFHLEGWKVAIPDIAGDSYRIAIGTAIKNSNITKEDIDLIIPHGVGTQVTDAYEAKAITDIFGQNPKKPLISAFKPYIGHNLGSTALLETVILLLALENGLIPPTLNCGEVDPKLNISLIRKLKKSKLRIVMKTACGFAGYNGACIFKKIYG